MEKAVINNPQTPTLLGLSFTWHSREGAGRDSLTHSTNGPEKSVLMALFYRHGH